MATPILFSPDFLNQLFQQIQDQATVWAVEMLKMIIETIRLSIRPYWPYLVIGFFILLVWSTIKAMLGKWGALGSLLYHVFYFGILGIFIKIRGLEILFNPFFDLIAFVVYRISYTLTGLIVGKFKRTV